MRTAILGVLAMTGCLRDPVFGQHDASSDGNDLVGCAIPRKDPSPPEQVVASVTAFGAGIVGPGYGLQFSRVGNVFAAFPANAYIGATQVLSSDGAACEDPNYMGVSFDPGGRVGAEDAGTGLEVTLDAPLIGQLRSTWAKTYTCSIVATMRGQTTFTGFPDGRIVRHDLLSNDAMVDAATCSGNGCAPTAGFTVASYTRFARSPDLGTQPRCIEHDLTARTAIAIDGPVNDPVPLRTSEGPQHAFFEWLLQSGGMLPASDIGPVVTTTYLSSTRSCAELTARLGLDYPVVQTDPPQLVVEDVAALMSAVDGIYRISGGSFHAASKVTLRPGVRRTGDGFAIELDLGPYTELSVARSRCVADEWYGVQLEPNGDSLLWFSGGLALDESIMIDIVR